MQRPFARRISELLRLAAKAWWVLVIGFLFGLAEVVEVTEDAHQHLYAFGAVAAFTLIAVLIWVAYQALMQRDEARAGRHPVSEEDLIVQHHHHYYEGGGPRFEEGDESEESFPDA